LEELWRTSAIQDDLQKLIGENYAIADKEIAASTKNYLNEIQGFSPKILLTHFLLHVAGFMHGGGIIQRKYILPSNKLTEYQIATQQYDFSSLWTQLPTIKQSTLGVYQHMMTQIDSIPLDETEYQECLQQGQNVYETMASIYDDLCAMHI